MHYAMRSSQYVPNDHSLRTATELVQNIDHNNNYLLLFSIFSSSLIVIKKRQFTIILCITQGSSPLPLSPHVLNKHPTRLISANAHHKSQIKNKFSSLRNSTDYTVTAKTIQSVYYPTTRSDTIRYRTVS